MRGQRRARSTVLSALITCMLVAPLVGAAAKPRTVLILPFTAVDLGRDDQWLGEALAQALMLGLEQAPCLVQIDRERLRQLPKPEAWDEAAASAAMKAVHADIAIYGEVRRSAGQLAIQPRYLEAKGERIDRVALDVVTIPEGDLMDRLRGLPLAYTRALKVALTESEAARVQKWASPTVSARAFEAYVQGQRARYRGGQDGNEAVIEYLGKAIE